jgi:hypothetical protein
MIIWEDRLEKVLQDRTRALEGDTTERAVKYRRLVSLCTKVPVDKVDGVSAVYSANALRVVANDWVRCWRALLQQSSLMDRVWMLVGYRNS